MSHQTLIPRPQTFELLARTPNPQAALALAAGLNSASRQLQSQCLKLLLGRKEPEAHQAIVSHWTKLADVERASLAKKTFELLPASRQLLKTGSQADKQAAIVAISELDMTAAVPDLILLALEKTNPLCDLAMQTLTTMCDRWGQRARQGSDLPSVRGPMIDALARVVHEFPMHQNTDLLDAWLCLVAWEDSAQRALINDPTHPAYQAIQDRLWNSQHRSVMQLLGGYLWRASTPKSILSILCERPDRELAICIAEMLNDNLLIAAQRRLRELPALMSLSGLAVSPTGLSVEVQRRLWLMLAANSPTIEPVLSGAMALTKLGTADGRRLAAEIVRGCRRRDLDNLVLYMQHAAANPDDKHCVGAHLQTVFSWLDSPSTVLKAAAQEFFAGFTLERLLEVIRQWPSPMCRVMASIVRRMEPDVVPQLLKALESPAPKKRIIALQVIRLMDISDEIKDRLLPLVDDPRVEVRVPAIDLLAAIGATELWKVLPALLDDPTTEIQEAAVRARRRLERRRKSVTAAVPTIHTGNPTTTGNEAAPC